MKAPCSDSFPSPTGDEMVISMNFPTLPYDNVTYSFLLEICFWGPTHPTFLYDVTLLDLFF